MLYSEFLKGTRAPETPDTYDQFQIIGQIYEDCEGMTKEEAYRIWKQTYGRELKRRELRQRERLELLINREDYDSADRPHRAAIYHELSTLFWAAYYVDTLVDYMLGKSPIYTVEDPDQDDEETEEREIITEYRKKVMKLLKDKAQGEFSDLLRDMCIGGFGSIIVWVDEKGTRKMQYSDAAKELSKRIDESYYNGSRIIRTEMTRANALGTSYALMENADIVEGKYRDATFDSKTSAYCAADADYSKQNPYDLDYDTPTNPGLPGRRIPNHPHCRCRWVAILSGLGIKNRQKAALDKYGDLYYTKATSYDDYAKEVGLPSVKDMVNADNPKKYLRPGETLADLNRQVVRKRFNGQIITVPLGLDIHN